MRSTQELIEALVANAEPVRRLRPPLARAALWLLLAATILGLLAIAHGVRADLAERLREPPFLLTLAASLLTGILAAAASFLLSLPDRSRAWAVLPLPALLVWFSTIGYGCLTHWVSLAPDGVHLGETARCFATMALTSVPLSAALLFMLRYAVWVRPRSVATSGSLAVAALTASALSLFHPLDASLMILIWNLGAAMLIVGLGAALGRRMLSWAARR